MSLLETYMSAFSRVLVVDFLRYFLVAGFGFIVFWVIFRDVLAHRFIQSRRPSKKRLSIEFLYSMSTVLIFASVGAGIILCNHYGLITIYTDAQMYGEVYLWLSPVLMILFHDTYFYWTHRWMHIPRVYKRVHRVHHLSTNPSPWAAYSFHPLEAVIQALVLPILLVFMPIYKGMIFVFLAYMIVRNVMGHLGYELFPSRFIRSKWLNWLTTTTHHNMHHERFHSNYGLYFTWWDRWLGTEHPAYSDRFEEVTNRKD